MFFRASLILGLVMGFPAAALASSIADEFGAGSSQTTPSNPRSGYISNRITGVADLSESVNLTLDATVTHDVATQGQRGVRFADTGGNIFAFSLGAEWEVSEHVLLGIDGNYSPSSTQRADAPISLQSGGGPASQVDAQVRSTGQSYGFLVQGGYQTAGESSFESSVDANASLTHLSTTQQIDALQTATGPETLQRVLDYCARNPKHSGCRQIQAAAGAQSAEFNQYQVGATFTGTFSGTTDLMLGGSYYLYDQDPLQVGYFSVASIGRSTTTLGSGVPIAPLKFTIRPEIAQKFGPIRADLWYQYGKYVPGEGFGHSVRLKLQIKFSKTWSAWVSATAQLDTDGQGNQTNSGGLALGVKARF